MGNLQEASKLETQEELICSSSPEGCLEAGIRSSLGDFSLLLLSLQPFGGYPPTLRKVIHSMSSELNFNHI